MSDERLRELERRWKETGSVEDEAKYLAERVRVGDLTNERLELAAYCGHQAAQRVAGSVHEDGNPTDVMEWTDGLRRWGIEPYARAAVAKDRCYESLRPLNVSDATRSVVDAFEDWILCPCGAHIESLVRLIGIRKADENIIWSVSEETLSSEFLGEAPSQTWKGWICDEIISWALGYRDPVGDRARARRSG
jgi:hypothetical protein